MINNWYNIFLHLVVIVLAVIIIFLVNKIYTYQLTSEGIGQFNVGDTFQDLLVKDLSGTATTIKLNSNKKEVILFIFSTTCIYCTNSIDNWNRLNEDTGGKYEIIGIAADDIDKVRNYKEKNNLKFKVYVPISNDFRKDYKISGVPQTIRLDKLGMVKHYWLGQFSDEALSTFKNLIAKDVPSIK